MRWNQFANDQVRAESLGDLLLGAAHAGGAFDDVYLAVVHGQVAKALGVSRLPAAVQVRMAAFDVTRFDVAAACARCGLFDPRDRVALLKTVVTVLRAEGTMSRAGRLFAMLVAGALEIPLSDVIPVVGMPERPITAPRPRPEQHIRG